MQAILADRCIGERQMGPTFEEWLQKAPDCAPKFLVAGNQRHSPAAKERTKYSSFLGKTNCSRPLANRIGAGEGIMINTYE